MSTSATSRGAAVAPEGRSGSVNLPGILLHQILQWHHMLTSEGGYPATTVAGLETNTLWDGLFHLSTWVATVAGLWVLWRRGRRATAWSGRHLLGLILAGWARSTSSRAR